MIKRLVHIRMDITEKDDSLICLDAFDIYHLIAWSESIVPRNQRLENMVPEKIKEQSYKLKKHVAENLFFELPYKDKHNHLYYIVHYTIPETVFDPKTVGLAVFDGKGQHIELENEKYEYVFWNLMYSRLMRIGVHLEILQRALPVVAEAYGETSMMINHLIQNNHSKAEEKITQSLKELYQIYDLNYKTSVLSQSGFNEIKEYDAMVLKSGYLTGENVQELFNMVCPYTMIYLYNRILQYQYKQAYSIVEEYLQLEDKISTDTKILSKKLLESIRENLLNKEEINLEKAAELYGIKPRDFIIANHPLLNTIIDERNFCTISWNTEVDRITEFIKQVSIRNIDS